MTAEDRRPRLADGGTDDVSDAEEESTRATLRTTHGRPSIVAAALRPDNTDEMDMQVVDGRIVTTIERETTGGLRSTVDDYVVNLSVADRIVEDPTEDANEDGPTDQPTDDSDQTRS